MPKEYPLGMTDNVMLIGPSGTGKSFVNCIKPSRERTPFEIIIDVNGTYQQLSNPDIQEGGVEQK